MFNVKNNDEPCDAQQFSYSDLIGKKLYKQKRRRNVFINIDTNISLFYRFFLLTLHI